MNVHHLHGPTPSYVIMVAMVWSLALVDDIPAQGSDLKDRIQSQTLEAALELVSPDIARLPLTLTAVRPRGASETADAWMIRGADRTGDRIGIYTDSEVFRWCELAAFP